VPFNPFENGIKYCNGPSGLMSVVIKSNGLKKELAEFSNNPGIGSPSGFKSVRKSKKLASEFSNNPGIGSPSGFKSVRKSKKLASELRNSFGII